MPAVAFRPFMLVVVAGLLVAGCAQAPPAAQAPSADTPVAADPTVAAPTPTPAPAAPPTALPTATAVAADPRPLWTDATRGAIGETAEWTNKVELADVDGDGRVDLLFANGGDYETPGTPVFSRVFLNQGPGRPFKEVSEAVFGPEGRLARVIKVCELSGDRLPDIVVGTTFQTRSQLYLGDGAGGFTNVTATHLPALDASIGDLECGDADADGDLDLALADWGPGSPMANQGGRTLLWLNDGTGRFEDATGERMPDVPVRFSWELEWADVDNDFDLDLLVSCKRCKSSFLFENDGAGAFRDVSAERMPQFTNNYDFEAMDLNADGFLDLVTINDGAFFREHLFLNDGKGGFVDASEELWAGSDNPGRDDNMAVFLDYDSDGDADVLIGTLDGPERLMTNDGSGRLSLNEKVLDDPDTYGTLGIAVADLDGDRRLDVVQAQGERSLDERVFLGTGLEPDTGPPVIALVEHVRSAGPGEPVLVRARVHDHKSPAMPHDWQSVVLRWTAGEQRGEAPLQWYGEHLWRGTIEQPPAGPITYEVCATDAAGNSACSESVALE
jgi:hypothetical protein